MITHIVLALAVAGPVYQTYEANMCFTGRYERSRHYFSECAASNVNYKDWCSRYKTKFAVTTESYYNKSACELAVRQNYPNLLRYKNRRYQPVICDFGIEGPLPRDCHG